MPNTQIAYPFDPTGNASTNRVTGERQVLTPGDWKQYHTIIPLKAPYFGASIKLRHQPSGRELEEGRDYSLTHRFYEASIKLGKPVYGSITFKDPNLKGVIEFIEYQTVGGEWTKSRQEIEEILANELTSPAITLWDEIVDLPKDFPVVDHQFDIKDLTGSKEIVREIYRIYEAIMLRYSGDGQGNPDQGLISHVGNKDNPHEVDKDDIGLGLVHNASFATDEEAMEGIANLVYMNPRGAKLLFDKLNQTNIASDESIRISLEELRRAIIDPANYYPKDRVNELLDAKLGRDETAADSKMLDGMTLTEVLANVAPSTDSGFHWGALAGQGSRWRPLLDLNMDSGPNAPPVVFRFTGSYRADSPQMSAVYSIWSPIQGEYRLKCIEGSPEYQLLGIVPTSSHARLYSRMEGPTGPVSIQVLYSSKTPTKVEEEVVNVIPQGYQTFHSLLKTDIPAQSEWMSCDFIKQDESAEFRTKPQHMSALLDEMLTYQWDRKTRPVSRDAYPRWTADENRITFTKSSDDVDMYGLYSQTLEGDYLFETTINPDQDMGGVDHGDYIGVSAIQVEVGGVSHSIDIMRTPGRAMSQNPNNRLWNISLNQRRDASVELGSISTGYKWGDGQVDAGRDFNSFQPTNNDWHALGPVTIRVYRNGDQLKIWFADGDAITAAEPTWEISLTDPKIRGLFTDRPVRWGLITGTKAVKAIWDLKRFPYQHPAYYVTDTQRYEYYNGDAWITHQKLPQSHFYHSPSTGMYWRRLRSGKLIPVFIAAQSYDTATIPTI